MDDLAAEAADRLAHIEDAVAKQVEAMRIDAVGLYDDERVDARLRTESGQELELAKQAAAAKLLRAEIIREGGRSDWLILTYSRYMEVMVAALSGDPDKLQACLVDLGAISAAWAASID